MSRYVTLEQVRAQSQVGDTLDDDVLTVALDAAEQQIDEHCRRRFDKVDPDDPEASTVRVYSPSNRFRVDVDDVVKVDTVEDRTSPTSDYAAVGSWGLWPSNADADGRPFQTVLSLTGRPFGSGFEAVRVTGWFGWPETPSPVVQATLLQASRLAQRRNAQFGIANVVGMDGTAGMRLLAKLDADVELMLSPFRRNPVLV